MNLQKTADHFFFLYGKRNCLFLPGLRERINFLNLALGDLQDAVRKEAGARALDVALARVVARIFCVADHFKGLPLTEAMVQKYGQQHCSYCQKMPCVCTERRSRSQLERVSLGERYRWGLREWCAHFNALYGAKNKEKGIENILNRLFKEVTELLSLQMDVSRMPGTLHEIEMEFALELADTLAWTIAAANFFEVDLEKAVFDRFGSNCWKCREIPCVCTHFNVTAVSIA